jgi:hypothetical protein
MPTDSELDGAGSETFAIALPSSPPRSSVLDTLLAFVHDVTGSGTVRDGLKLIVVGGILEASRRGLTALCKQVYYCESLDHLSSVSILSSRLFASVDATIEAIFSEDDPAYRWIIAWLSVPERQQDARNFEVISTKYQDDLPEQLAGVEDVEKGNRALSRGLALIPAFGECHLAQASGHSAELIRLFPRSDHPRYIKFEGRMYRFERYTENKLFGDPVAMLKVR